MAGIVLDSRNIAKKKNIFFHTVIIQQERRAIDKEVNKGARCESPRLQIILVPV